MRSKGGYLEQPDNHEHSIQGKVQMPPVEVLVEGNRLPIEEVVEKYHILLLLVEVVGFPHGDDGGGDGHGDDDDDYPCLLH